MYSQRDNNTSKERNIRELDLWKMQCYRFSQHTYDTIGKLWATPLSSTNILCKEKLLGILYPDIRESFSSSWCTYIVTRHRYVMCIRRARWRAHSMRGRDLLSWFIFAYGVVLDVPFVVLTKPWFPYACIAGSNIHIYDLHYVPI